MAIEEPNYTVIETSDAFELRAYEPMIVAETLGFWNPRRCG